MRNLTALTTARWELLNKASSVLSTESMSLLSELLTAEIGFPSPDNKLGPNVPIAPIAPLPDLKGDAKVALCVGHARSNDAGAIAFNGIYEEPFNNDIVKRVQAELASRGIQAEIINYYPGSGYGQAMKWLAKHLLDNGFTHAFEFHFNSATPSAHGYEYLHWHKSKKGVIMANVFQRLHGETFLDKTSRGVEPLGDEAHERGVLFCSITHCPAIILEPFFGSNKEDAESYMSDDGKAKLSNFYANAIHESIIELAAAA